MDSWHMHYKLKRLEMSLIMKDYLRCLTGVLTIWKPGGNSHWQKLLLKLLN